ncbi:MAG: hypothetical protein GY868_14400 [Deltaproteobacteria bacterium]|nr:hypothetical protein [Deltaproteobacteria bacterium]
MTKYIKQVCRIPSGTPGGILIIFILFGLCCLTACATTGPVLDDTARTGRESARPEYPPYKGPRIPVAVLPMGLSERAAKRYPHLLDKSVGLGVHHVLTDALYRTNRFRFVEEKEAVVKDVMQRQWLSASGAVDQNSAVRLGRMLGARKVIYGEVYDYAEGKTETLRGLRVIVEPKIRVGIHIRLVDIETLEYIPASDTSYGPDWGEASSLAIEKAVAKLFR